MQMPFWRPLTLKVAVVDQASIFRRCFTGSTAFPTRRGTFLSIRFYLKDLVHFYVVDPFFRKSIIVDRQFHTSVMDLSNLCPIVPFLGDNRDRELKDLGAFLMSLTKSDDVKVGLSAVFDIRKALKCESIDSIIKYLF